jgi:hypothetical protein
MANNHRGSVALQAGSVPYTLSFSVNALCELEDAFNQPVAKIAETLGKPESIRLSTVRTLVWAALRDHHEEMDIKAAGDVVTDAGMAKTMAAIGKAFELAFPAPSGKENPRKAKAS